MTHAHRFVQIFVVAFASFIAILIFSSHLLPFIDLPNHLAEATIYKFYDQEDNVLSHFYKPTPWYFPNTFHTVFCSLFPDVELGNKVFVWLCLVLVPVSVLLAIREVGGNVLIGILSILFTFNYNLTYGFVGFAISIPTLILLFYCTLLDVRRDKLQYKLLIAILLVVLFWMHAQNALLGLLLFGVLTIVNCWGEWKKIVIRLVLIPLPLITMLFYWWFTRTSEKEESTLDFLVNYYKTEYFSKIWIRLRIVALDNFQLFEGSKGMIVAFLFFLCILVPLAIHRKSAMRAFSSIDRRHAVNALLLFFTVFGCYMLLPDQLPGQSPLFQRFCTIVILAFIVLTSILLRNANSLGLRSFLIITSIVYVVLWSEYIISFNRDNHTFRPTLFQGIPNHNRMAGLIYDNEYRGRKVYIHYPNYFIVWRKGIAASKIIDYRFGVVRKAKEEVGLPYYHEFIGDTYEPINTYQSLEFLLVRGESPVFPDVNTAGFSLRKAAEPWKVLENGKFSAHQP